MNHQRGEAVYGKHIANRPPTEMVVNDVVVDKSVEKQADEDKAEQYVERFKPNVSLNDVMTAAWDVVGHTEHFLHHQLAYNNTEGYDKSDATKQQPSHPSEMVKAKGQEYDNEKQCNKCAL